MVGYYGLFMGLEYANDREMTQKLDASGYSESEEILVKVPLTMPYGRDSEDYERIDGKFHHNGEYYRLVKQRMYHDTLFVVCVKDQQSKRIDEARGEFAKTLTDTPSDQANQTAKSLSGFSKDYIAHTFSIRSVSTGWERDVLSEPSLAILVSDFYPSITHPPERG